MGLVLSNDIMGGYFSFLTKLDNVTKKQLIIKLTESLEFENKEDFDLKSLCGTWEDDRSSDEIIKDIRSSRVEKTNTINL